MLWINDYCNTKEKSDQCERLLNRQGHSGVKSPSVHTMKFFYSCVNTVELTGRYSREKEQQKTNAQQKKICENENSA